MKRGIDKEEEEEKNNKERKIEAQERRQEKDSKGEVIDDKGEMVDLANMSNHKVSIRELFAKEKEILMENANKENHALRLDAIEKFSKLLVMGMYKEDAEERDIFDVDFLLFLSLSSLSFLLYILIYYSYSSSFFFSENLYIDEVVGMGLTPYFVKFLREEEDVDIQVFFFPHFAKSLLGIELHIVFYLKKQEVQIQLLLTLKYTNA